MDNLAATITVDLVDGTKVVVPDSLEHITAYVLQEQNDWFEDEIKFLRSLVKPGDVVVDIGANYGVYALSLARKVGPSGQVWAFEPATDTAKLLEESVTANGTDCLRVVQQALSDRQGTAWLQMPGQAELNSLVSRDSDGVTLAVGPGEAVTVTTLDSCIEEFGWSIVDLLKIDAEGEEERILRGGARFFEDLSPLVMFEVKAGMELHLDLVCRFQELGYQCFHLIPGLNALAPFDADKGVDGYLLNLFAAKPDRVQTLEAAGRLIGHPSIPVGPQAVQHNASWNDALNKSPYAQVLMPRWLANSQQPEQAVIHQALAAWNISQACNEPIARRYDALVHSYTLLRRECQPGCRSSRWASLARICLALGERQQAMEALSAMLSDLQSGREPVLDEPFLCPDPALDAVNPADQLRAWLVASALAAMEKFGSFSGFFTGRSAVPRLESLISLGFADEDIQRRLDLVIKRFSHADQQLANLQSSQPSIQPETCSKQQADSDISVRAWFDFLGLQQPLRCVDVGALALKDHPDPWVHWVQIGCAEVLVFQPLNEECNLLNVKSQRSDVAIRHFPWVLGDGKKHTLHITNAPMSSSLFPPACSTTDLFQSLGEFMHVIRQEVLETHRLDDIKEAQLADFIKLDAQGAELMILENAKVTLKSVSVIQCEVEFVELYEGQPLMADVDSFLRSQGFTFLRFLSIKGRPYKPLQLSECPDDPISQALWADAIYIRDFRRLSHWDNHQLKAAVFLLHELYRAFDLSAFLLNELDRRCGTSLEQAYLSSLLVSDCSLQINLS
ncbi:FkbM family methyltransferase [Synechococcus sp. CCY 0621]|uniref:FkbM family methyltransferase n=1 Tax=Synechococcus sp. CCY 0621 TaxID=2815603 RepID=UPI001C21F76E|nr:FkbM family methyltransferase [Synechococcus sp. CCY 0621]